MKALDELRKLYRLAGIIERLDRTVDQLSDGTRRALRDLQCRQCSVLLLGTGSRANPVCCSWTGIVPEGAQVQGTITAQLPIDRGAWLVSLNGALFRSVRVGCNEQFANHSQSSGASACQLGEVIMPGLDVFFTLQLRAAP